MQFALRLTIASVVSFVLMSCASQRIREFHERGLASWYGRKFNRHITASGERYDMHALTAAHPSLPFNTIVRVRDLRTGKEINVRINDRGPYAKGRVIDLSYEAARQLGLVDKGEDEVELILAPSA